MNNPERGNPVDLNPFTPKERGTCRRSWLI